MLCSPLRRKKEKKPPQWLAPATASHGYWACGCMTIFSSNSLQKGWHPTHDDLTDRLGRAKSQQDLANPDSFQSSMTLRHLWTIIISDLAFGGPPNYRLSYWGLAGRSCWSCVEACVNHDECAF